MNQALKTYIKKHPFIFSIIALCLLIFITRTTIIHSAWITSGSMLPSFQVDERILANQLAWGLNTPWGNQQSIQWATPQRGEVVLFHNPNDDGHIWMKRVIGIAGDSIAFKDHLLYINGIVCSKSSRHNEQLPRQDGTQSAMYRVWPTYFEQDWGPITIAQGEMFLMGDNRGSSLDSRTWGSIPIHYLSGKPLMRIWPLASFKWLSY